MILPTTVGSPRRPTTNSPAMAWTPRSTREKPVGALWKMSLPRTPATAFMSGTGTSSWAIPPQGSRRAPVLPGPVGEHAPLTHPLKGGPHGPNSANPSHHDHHRLCGRPVRDGTPSASETGAPVDHLSAVDGGLCPHGLSCELLPSREPGPRPPSPRAPTCSRLGRRWRPPPAPRRLPRRTPAARQTKGASAGPDRTDVVVGLWGAGTLGMLLWGGVSYLRLRRRTGKPSG